MTNGTRSGWGVSVTPRPLFNPGKDPVPIVQEAGWAPGPVWTGAENLASTGIRFPDRPARSQSLYRLSYTGPRSSSTVPLLFLSDFNETGIFSTDFRKILKCKISLKSVQWELSCYMRTDGQTSSSSSSSYVMESGHLLTRSGPTYPEVSSKVCQDCFCQLGNSVSLPWVIYYGAFYLHVVSSFSYIPVICLKLVLF